ncbi:MAG: cytochrome c [Pseudomonadota bacterium]
MFISFTSRLIQPRPIQSCLGLLALPLLVALAGATYADNDRFGIGRSAEPDDIRRLSLSVMPDGRGLPEGEGSVATGEALYTRSCASCHGEAGHGGPSGSLAGEPMYSPLEFSSNASLKKTVGNYWPHATTLFDYIRRAMPFDRPGSLEDEEVYALTAYLLYLNGVVDEDTVLNCKTMRDVTMPASGFFRSAWPKSDTP